MGQGALALCFVWSVCEVSEIQQTRLLIAWLLKIVVFSSPPLILTTPVHLDRKYSITLFMSVWSVGEMMSTDISLWVILDIVINTEIDTCANAQLSYIWKILKPLLV